MYSSKKQAIKHYCRTYVSEVFEPKLRQEGFMPYNDALCCWLRKKNDVIDYVFFYTSYNAVPVFIEIAYGIEPTFVPLFTTSTYRPTVLPDHTHRFYFQPFTGPACRNLNYYRKVIPVLCPNCEGYGIHTLENTISPYLEQVNTIEDCWNFNKNKWIEASKKIANISSIWPGALVDQGIYHNDTQMCPYFGDTIDSNMHIIEENLASNSRRYNKEALKKEYAEWELRKAALEPGGRDAYLAILSERSKKTLAQFERIRKKQQ